MENIIRNVLANYFDTTNETQTQHLTPNFNSHTLNDMIDFDQQQLKEILPILKVKKIMKNIDFKDVVNNSEDVVQSLTK